MMVSASNHQPCRRAWLCLVAVLLLANVCYASTGKAPSPKVTKPKKKGMSREGTMKHKTKKQMKEIRMPKRGPKSPKDTKAMKAKGMMKMGSKADSKSFKDTKAMEAKGMGKASSKAAKMNTKSKSSGKKVSARKILQMVIDAIGGEDVLMGLMSLELEATGETWTMFESEEPEELVETSSYDRTYALDFGNDRYRVDETATPRFEAFGLFPAQTFSRVVNGNVGGLEGSNNAIQAGTLPSESVAALKRQQMFFNPHLLLQEAVKDPGIVSSGKKSEGYHVLVIDDDISDIHLYVDATSGFPAKLETMEANPLIRDTQISIHYNDWDMESEGLLFPRTVELYAVNGLLWTEERSFAEINMVDKIDESIFDLPPDTDPDSFDADRFKFGLQAHHTQEGFFELGFLFPFNAGLGSPVELATGLNLLPSLGSSNSLAIGYGGGVIIVEAPGSEVHAMELLSAVENLFPGIEVTHLIQSHHHVDHASGVRQVLGSTDATLVVGSNFKDFWEEDVLHAKSTIRPDSISKDGYGGKIEGIPIKASKVLVDEDNLVVTVYQTDLDPHAMDNIFTTIEADGMVHVFVADMYNAGFGLTVVVGGPEGFFDAMREVGLIDEDCSSDQPLSIIPAHGFVQTLEESIAELTGLGIDVGCS